MKNVSTDILKLIAEKEKHQNKINEIDRKINEYEDGFVYVLLLTDHQDNRIESFWVVTKNEYNCKKSMVNTWDYTKVLMTNNPNCQKIGKIDAVFCTAEEIIQKMEEEDVAVFEDDVNVRTVWYKNYAASSSTSLEKISEIILA
jgi:hypothetical protein